jgi:hypothetical protein
MSSAAVVGISVGDRMNIVANDYEVLDTASPT